MKRQPSPFATEHARSVTGRMELRDGTTLPPLLSQGYAEIQLQTPLLYTCLCAGYMHSLDKGACPPCGGTRAYARLWMLRAISLPSDTAPLCVLSCRVRADETDKVESTRNLPEQRDT